MIRVPAGLSIMVVDDDEVDRMIIDRVIGRSSLENEVRLFARGRDAIDHLDTVRDRDEKLPGLALLDINMPGLTGFDVLAHIKSRPEFEALPVVVMLTSSDAHEDKRRAAELGATTSLAKQSGIERYTALIEQHFTN